jgi:hypothetical protein
MSEKLTAPEVLAQAAQEPTIDEYLKRDPATLSPKDLGKIVEIERRRRAMFITADAQKKEKPDASE